VPVSDAETTSFISNFSIRASTNIFLCIRELDVKTILYASERDSTVYPSTDDRSDESIVAKVEFILVPKHA
jgi:hypothetical protein